MIVAARNGHVSVVECLLMNNADSNIEDRVSVVVCMHVLIWLILSVYAIYSMDGQQ